VGLAVPSGLTIHVVFQHEIGGGILGPLLSIKYKIFVKVKQLLKYNHKEDDYIPSIGFLITWSLY